MVLRRPGEGELAVIGGGMAGLAAAHHAALLGHSVALFESSPMFGGQVANVEAVDFYPAPGALSGIDLTVDLIEKGRALGVAIHNTEVSALSAGPDIGITTATGEAHRARAVVVATGARLKTLDVPGEAALVGRGVSQCASCDGPMFQGDDVAVIGGGDAAAQEALVLAEFCRKVTIVCRGAMRAKRSYVDRLTNRENVAFHWDAEVEHVIGDGIVDGIRLRNTKDGAVTELPCKGVFPFIGATPNGEFLPDAVDRDDGYVVTDSGFRTGLPGVFAAGAVRRGYGGQLAESIGEAVSAARAASEFLRRG